MYYLSLKNFIPYLVAFLVFRGTACCSSSSISVLESSTNRLEFSAISREIFREKIFITAGFEFRGQFPYLDKLQYTGFIQWVESQSDYQKFNIQCLVINKLHYLLCTKN